MMFAIAIILLILITFSIQRGFFLNSENNYKVINEDGETIPAKIYSRTVKSKIKDKEESLYEILVFFDDNQGMKTYDPILFIPKYNMVGIVEGGKREFIFFGKYCFQKSEMSNTFTTLTNTLVFDDDPPIKKIVYNDNEIIFNSFEGLEKYGKKIILKLN